MLIDKINSLLIGKSRITPSGWVSINCPACVYNGEPSPDTRFRGGLKINMDGAVTYNCHRCHFKAHWRPGLYLGRKMQLFLNYLNMDYSEIEKLTFDIWRENQLITANPTIFTQIEPTFFNKSFAEVELPTNARSIYELLENNFSNKDFLDSINYLIENRGSIIAKSYDYYWSPEKKNGINRSLLIPFYYEDKIVGWSARRIDKTKVRYYSSTPADYIFMNHNLSKKNRKYVILVEGVFDSIAIDGVAALGGSLNKKQINWINGSGKEIIVVPDRSKDASTLIETAIDQNWYVSIPPRNDAPSYTDDGTINIWSWHSDVKDAADAVKKYGRLFTVQSIIENKTKDKIKIQLYKTMFMK